MIEPSSCDIYQPIATFVLKTYSILSVKYYLFSCRKTHRSFLGTATETVLLSKTPNYLSVRSYLFIFATANTRASFVRYNQLHTAQYVQFQQTQKPLKTLLLQSALQKRQRITPQIHPPQTIEKEKILKRSLI